MQFSRDDVARIMSSVLTQVFVELSLQHVLEGIAVLPAGDSTYLVDGVMRDHATNELRVIAITIPPTQEKGVNPSEPGKQFEVLSISRDYLQSIGMHPKQVARLTNEDMKRLAEILAARLFDSEFDGDVVFSARLILAEKRKE